MNAAVIREARFAPVGREEWLGLAEQARRGASFEEALVSKTDDGIRIEPLYDRVANPQPLARSGSDPRWSIVQRIDDTDPVRANPQALDDIAGGATGLTLVFEGAPNAFGYGLPANSEALSRALDNVALNRTHLRIDAHPASRASADWLTALLAARRVDPAKLSLSFGIDPAATFGGVGWLRMSIEALQASLPQSLAHFFALGVPGVILEADGRVYHNAGATEAQELGAMLATAVSHLRLFEAARQPLLYAAPHIGFAISADQDQLASMAKIRALRLLWARIQELCGIEPPPARIHAETSYRMMTSKDAETNILRTTIAAFAAAAGGADTIAILPHTIAHGLPDGFARRVARNAQLILADESHLDFVLDPAAGSGGIEALTAGLCAAAWREFQRIEAEGGILASLAGGALQARIGKAREDRAARYASGERAIVGTTLYPQVSERKVVTLPAGRRTVAEEAAVTCERLTAMRIDEIKGARG